MPRPASQGEVLEALASAYRTVLGTRSNRSREQMLVLADLRRFCRADRPTYSPTDRETALREGRREVWLRMTEALELPEPTVAEILSVTPTVVTTTEDTAP